MSVKQTFSILGFGLDQESELILQGRLHNKSSQRTNSRSTSRRQKTRPECLQVLLASREARLGHRVSDSVDVKGLGLCGWMLNCVVFFGCVVWLPASREARLGRRGSDCVVASKVCG